MFNIGLQEGEIQYEESSLFGDVGAVIDEFFVKWEEDSNREY